MSDLLDCIICHDKLFIPTTLSCGHTFCRECLIAYFKSSIPTGHSDFRPCITCKKGVLANPKELNMNIVINDILTQQVPGYNERYSEKIKDNTKIQLVKQYLMRYRNRIKEIYDNKIGDDIYEFKKAQTNNEVHPVMVVLFMSVKGCKMLNSISRLYNFIIEDDCIYIYRKHKFRDILLEHWKDLSDSVKIQIIRQTRNLKKKYNSYPNFMFKQNTLEEVKQQFQLLDEFYKVELSKKSNKKIVREVAKKYPNNRREVSSESSNTSNSESSNASNSSDSFNSEPTNESGRSEHSESSNSSDSE